MLAELLSQYDSCNLECDGLTRVLATVLLHKGIEHRCMIGSLLHKTSGLSAPLHFWIELPDNTIVDYRARMWLGEAASVPHGIFKPENYPEVTYRGRTTQLDPLPQYLFNILTK